MISGGRVSFILKVNNPSSVVTETSESNIVLILIPGPWLPVDIIGTPAVHPSRQLRLELISEWSAGIESGHPKQFSCGFAAQDAIVPNRFRAWGNIKQDWGGELLSIPSRSKFSDGGTLRQKRFGRSTVSP